MPPAFPLAHLTSFYRGRCGSSCDRLCSLLCFFAALLRAVAAGSSNLGAWGSLIWESQESSRPRPADLAPVSGPGSEVLQNVNILMNCWRLGFPCVGFLERKGYFCCCFYTKITWSDFLALQRGLGSQDRKTPHWSELLKPVLARAWSSKGTWAQAARGQHLCSCFSNEWQAN